MDEDIPKQIIQLYQQLHLLYEQTQHEEATQSAAQLCQLVHQYLHEGNQATVEIAEVLNGVGMIYLSLGNFTQAGLVLHDALNIRQHLLEEHDPATAQSLNNLAGYYEVLGRYTEAEQLYQRSLAIRVALFGDVHVDVALTLNNLAQIYRATGKYAQAESHYQQALTICRSCLEENHPMIGTLLNNLAIFYHDLGNYTRAKQHLEQALAIYSLSLGPFHPDVARTFNNLASIYQSCGEYAQAETYYQQALSIRQIVLGNDHPDVAQILNNQAALFQKMGRYIHSIPLYQRALAIYRNCLPETHPTVIRTMHNLATLHQAIGDFQASERLLQEVVAMHRQASAPSPLDIALSLHNLATLYYTMGNYIKALPLFQEAIERQIAIFGKEHPDIATSYHNLALLHQQQGNYDQAEFFYQRASHIWHSSLGDSHPNVAALTDSMASLAAEIGDYDRAKGLYEQALSLQEIFLGKSHPSLAVTINNLAMLNHLMEHYSTTITLGQQALQILRPLVLNTHPLLATILNNIALAYYAMKDYEQARILYHQALDIWQSSPEGFHPSGTCTLLNLGGVYSTIGDYTLAEQYYQRAAEIIRSTLGEAHPLLSLVLNNSATIYIASGRQEEALAQMCQAANIEDRVIGQVFLISSENQRMAHLATLRGHLDGLLSLMIQYPSHPSIVHDTFSVVLRRKGIAAEAIATQRDAILSGRYPQLTSRLNQLTTLRMQIAQKALSGPGPEGLLAHQQLLDQWISQKEQLEAELAQNIPEMNLSQRLAHVDCKTIADALPPGTALIEFVRFNIFDFAMPHVSAKDRWRPAHYVAFILFANQPDALEAVDLGDAERIDQKILKFNEALLVKYADQNQNNADTLTNAYTNERNFIPPQGINTSYASQNYIRQGVTLREILFDPLLNSLKGCKQLFISPDATLNQLSFETLPTQENNYILDEYHICYISAGRDLLRFQAIPDHPEFPSLVVADPDFNLCTQPAVTLSTTPELSQTGKTSRDLDRSSCFFERLPGTLKEGEQIAALLNAQLLTGIDALKACVKATHSPRIMHIATHGFFLPDQQYISNSIYDTIEAPTEGNLNLLGRIQRLQIENPLLRSGLALAGANTWCKGGNLPVQAEDGILTAEDVTGLNLLDTELVVLSACETGLGLIQRGEGVFGLRRSFLLAGAKRLVMSLWKVQDDLTQELMFDFYQRMLNGISCAEALYEAKRELKKRHVHPYHWGAFIYQGDPAPLPPCRH